MSTFCTRNFLRINRQPDSKLIRVIGDADKIISWYDNEWGYSNRVKDLILFLVKKGL